MTVGFFGFIAAVVIIAFIERLFDVTVAELVARFLRLLLGGG